MTTTPQQDIRGVLIAVTGARLLLPNATIAEVLSFAPPAQIENAPDWLLGRMRWRGWQLPLIAFSRMAGIAAEQGGLGSKVVVLKAMGGDSKSPYFAILTQGFPRLVTVSRDRMVSEPDDNLPTGVRKHVWLNEDEAYIPDLEAIEAMIGGALTQAA
ncbi:chemotaxis protein CheW [Lysobacter fragariae]